MSTEVNVLTFWVHVLTKHVSLGLPHPLTPWKHGDYWDAMIPPHLFSLLDFLSTVMLDADKTQQSELLDLTLSEKLGDIFLF